MNNIQLFTDGGTFGINKISISIGLMFLNKHNVLHVTKINHNKESDFAELFAINKLLSRAYGFCKQKKLLDDEYTITVYTDSLTSIDSILSDSYTTNNERRAILISEIREGIAKFDNKVVFNHIKSHISGNNLKLSHKMYCKQNNVEIPFDEFLFIYQQNKKCDNLVAREYKKLHKKKIQETRRLELSKRELKELEEFDADII